MNARLTNRPVQDVIASIDALHLESVKRRLMDAEVGKGWSREYADSVEAAYKTYLKLVAKYQDDAEEILLSKDVDEFWHTHILQTQKYTRDCEQVFGAYLHHDPHIERDAVYMAKREKMVAKTQRLYASEFGEGMNAGAAWSGRRGAAADAAYSSASVTRPQVAYSSASIHPHGAAYSSAAVRAGDAAYSSAAIREQKAAYSSAAIVGAGAAYSSAAIRAGDAAYSSAAIREQKAAYSSAAVVGAGAAYSSAAIRAGDAAYSSAAIRKQEVAYSSAAIVGERAAYSSATVAAKGIVA